MRFPYLRTPNNSSMVDMRLKSIILLINISGILDIDNKLLYAVFVAQNSTQIQKTPQTDCFKVLCLQLISVGSNGTIARRVKPCGLLYNHSVKRWHKTFRN